MKADREAAKELKMIKQPNEYLSLKDLFVVGFILTILFIGAVLVTISKVHSNGAQAALQAGKEKP